MEVTTRTNATHKSRGVCKYYTTKLGCHQGDRCKFSHSTKPDSITPWDEAKTCKFYAQGFCRRGDQCWFKHVDPEPTEDSEEDCSICMDRPVTYGLLSHCGHIFCIDCIRKWRSHEEDKSQELAEQQSKKCPLCRTTSKFIVPSSKFYGTGDPRKIEAMTKYQESTARVPCKYFKKSKGQSCPFGGECFYQHRSADGTEVKLSRRSGGPRQPTNLDDLIANFQVPDGFLAADAADINHPGFNNAIRQREGFLTAQIASALQLLTGGLLDPSHAGGASDSEDEGDEDGEDAGEAPWVPQQPNEIPTIPRTLTTSRLYATEGLDSLGPVASGSNVRLDSDTHREERHLVSLNPELESALAALRDVDALLDQVERRSTALAEENVTAAPAIEPPQFVTDGRGGVTWNTGSQSVDEGGSNARNEDEEEREEEDSAEAELEEQLRRLRGSLDRLENARPPLHDEGGTAPRDPGDSLAQPPQAGPPGELPFLSRWMSGYI